MHDYKRLILPVIVLPLLAAAAFWYRSNQVGSVLEEALSASGTVEAVEINVAAETAGRVVEVLVEKGQPVQAGQALFRLDDELLQAQRQRAGAALSSAQAGVAFAETGLEAARAGLTMTEAGRSAAAAGLQGARVQYELALNAARLAEAPLRSTAWQISSPGSAGQPNWYFDRLEQRTAADAEAAAAQEALTQARGEYEQLLQGIFGQAVSTAESRLAAAETGWRAAAEVLTRARAQQDSDLREAAQDLYDAAQEELDDARAALDDLLSGEENKHIRPARARLAVAQERYDLAQDRLAQMLTGEDALQVQAARALVAQAEAGADQVEAALEQAQAALAQAEARLEQAQKAVDQAQAELALIDVQMAKLVVYSPVKAVATMRNIQPGEVILPGAAALTLIQNTQLTIKVFVPEDRYGQIQLGSSAKVRVDSFPGETFTARVVRIADRAEFTPRNVQTEEGRRTTVFAVEVTVQDTQGKLKAGMPADVTFGE
jgi:HlyD family secretion protein